MREVIAALRVRFDENRRCNAALESWRILQLDILHVVRRLNVLTAEREHVVASTPESRAMLWTLLEDGFWMECDPARLASLVEEVLVELERSA